jgi:hypothetical protein
MAFGLHSSPQRAKNNPDMSGFYERLGLSPLSQREEIQKAYHRGLARLVKKHRKAEASGADTAAIEAERNSLVEAHDVLADPNRRRSYDHFLSLESDTLEEGAEAFWAQIRDGMVEPGTAAALEVVRALTSLPLGDAPENAPQVETVPPPPDFNEVVDVISFESELEASREPEPEKMVIGAGVPAGAENAQTFNTELGFTFDRPEPVMATPLGNGKSLSLREIGALIEANGYDGRLLAAVRQARGLSMEAVADATKISTRYVQAIETNAFDRLPSAIFVRGYLKEIARVLELEPEALTEGYLGLYQRQRGA